MNRFYLLLLIALVLLLGYLSYQILEPFLVPIAWAVVFSILFYPLYAVILKYIRWPSIASLIVLVLILVMVIGPFTYLSISLVKEIGALIDRMGGETFALRDILDHPAIQTAAGRITSLFSLDPEELNKAVGDQVSRWGTELIGRITAGIRNVVVAVVNFLIMSLTIFFLLRAGPDFFRRILQYLPFSEEQKGRLVNQVRDIIVSTIYGGVIIALVQGTAGGLAFFLLDISSPVLWGLAMSVASFLPLVGPSIIWLPASLYLYFQGAVAKAVILVVVGVAGIGGVDYFLRPLIIGHRTQMPFLFIFFSVLGGIRLFGLIGLILGPMVLALFMSILEISRTVGEENRT